MTTVFGNPGSTEIPFLRDWPADFDYVLGLQESSVVAMADGFAQLTDNASFVNLHSAAGLGNALGAIFTAFRNQVPLVITAGQQARNLLSTDPYLFAERATEFPRPYVKWAIEPARPEDVPAAIERAYYTAMQKPCGPTFVSIPADDWESPVALYNLSKTISRRTCADPSVMEQLANCLKAARRPAFVVGAEVDRDGGFHMMVTLAEKLGASVWEAPVASRASFPETHPLFSGFLPATPQGIRGALAPYDVVVVVGAPAFTFHIAGDVTNLLSNAKVFHISDDPAVIARSPVGIGTVGSPRLAIQDLIGRLKDQIVLRDRWPVGRDKSDRVPESAPMSPSFIMQTIAEVIPANAIVVEEAPSHRVAMQRHLPISSPAAFFTMSSGGLGYGLPAAVGIALAAQSRRVICLTGDGSVMYSLQALWTAVRRCLPLTVVVLNNGGYGAMRAFGSLLGRSVIPGTELPGLDFMSLARGHGCEGTRVHNGDGLRRALQVAFRSSMPMLIDVTVDPNLGTLY